MWKEGRGEREDVLYSVDFAGSEATGRVHQQFVFDDFLQLRTLLDLDKWLVRSAVALGKSGDLVGQERIE